MGKTYKTNEQVPESGRYYCTQHPESFIDVSKGGGFPKCKKGENGDHDAEWTLERGAREKSPDEDGNSGQEKKEDEKKSTEDAYTTNEEDEKERKFDSSGTKSASRIQSFERTYKKVGFFAAIHQKNFPKSSEYQLDEVLTVEDQQAESDKAGLLAQYEERLRVAKEEYDKLESQYNEKVNIKQAFVDSLDKMQQEYESLLAEIKGYYVQLRTEIKSFGTTKENLILKRIEEFEKEVDRIVKVYHSVETIQNEKFKKDFSQRNIPEKDKKFYYDYRQQLEESFSDIKKRLGTLRSEGLSETAANFLIMTGWVSALVTSWFLSLWYAPTSASSSSVLVYVLDNLRNFVLNYGWLTSTIVFLSYIIIVLIISYSCFLLLRKFGLAGKKSNKKLNNKGSDDADSVEFNVDNEIKIQAQFKGETIFELWLKITPLLAAIGLLIIILALGSNQQVKDAYEGLSDSLFVQLVGLAIPVALTSIGFLYIIRFIERRNEQQNKQRTSWEIVVVVLSFLVLVVLLIVNNFSPNPENKRIIGAWGFLVGCMSTSLALAFGYRFNSLVESSSRAAGDLDAINNYIDYYFYPFEVAYLKHPGSIQRMKFLYHSLLDLTEARNELALKIVNTNFKSETEKQSANNSDHEEESAENASENTEGEKELENDGKAGNFWSRILNIFKQQEKKWKQRLKEKDSQIKNAQNKIEDMKKDTVTADELVYYPESSSKIKEIKILIEERNARLLELKAELDGYFRNEKTYASLNQQIQNIIERRKHLSKEISRLEDEQRSRINDIINKNIRKKIFIQEGYQIGLWFRENAGAQAFNQI